METAPGTNVSGFCYVGRNGRGAEVIVGGSFGTTRTKSKRRMQTINHLMCEARRPRLEPVAVVACTITVHGVVREFDEGEIE